MEGVLIIAMLIAVSTVVCGSVMWIKTKKVNAKGLKKHLGWSVGSFVCSILTVFVMMVPDMVHAATQAGSVNPAAGLGYIAAALSTGLATIGAGYAVGAVGSSALGAVSEDPKILGKTLIFVGLAEGIAIYGMIISILIIGKL